MKKGSFTEKTVRETRRNDFSTSLVLKCKLRQTNCARTKKVKRQLTVGRWRTYIHTVHTL